jgi:hypothetical protein
MQFDLNLLFTPTLVIFFATLLITFKITRSLIFSMIAALIKAGIFMLYFGALFDGTFTFLDDWGYLEIGRTLYEQNIGITNLMENLDFVQMLNRGDHYFYSIYNTYALQLFGIGYYAPVAFNILLTILIAWFGANLAEIEFGFNDVWKKRFFVFLLFHPDIFAWSNIMNGKDILVLLLHILLLSSVSLYFRGRVFTSLWLALFACYILSGIRFYVPMLFGSAFVLSLLLMQKNHYSLLKLFVSFIGIATFFLLNDFNLQENLTVINENFTNPIYGFIHFILTPIPFGTDESYSFLDVPALIHWILIPFAIKGVFVIFKHASNYERFFLLYLLIFVSLYSTFGELQGPRHRVQLDFAWAVLQFTGLKPFLHRILRPWSRSRQNQTHIKMNLAGKLHE